MRQSKPDERLLQFARNEHHAKVINAIIDSDTIQEAADSLGLSRNRAKEILSETRKTARMADNFMMPLIGQSHIVRDPETGKMTHWNKTMKDKSAMTLDEIRAGINCKLAKPKAAPKITHEDICSVLPIADVHLGMLAYSPETGGESWGTDTARDLVMQSIDYLLPKKHKVKHGMILNVGDLDHYDMMQPMTSQSRNVLDADARPGYITRTATGLMVYAIDRMLLHCETLDVVNLQGNHDSLSQIIINTALQMRYQDEPRVTIRDNDCKVQMRVWGKNFIYAHHGDGVTNQKMYNAMTRDFPREFGNANYHWGVCGHLHSSRKEPIGAANIETLQTLAPCDAWHASKLYGARRGMSRIDLHINGGELGRKTFNPVLHAMTEGKAA